VYDWHERRSALVHLLDPTTTQAEFAGAAYEEHGDFVDQAFEVLAVEPGRVRLQRDGVLRSAGQAHSLRVEKTLLLGGDRVAPTLTLEVRVENRSAVTVETILAVEWALNLLGGGGNPQAWYQVGADRSPHDGSAAHEAPATVSFGNDWLGVAIEVAAEPRAAVWWQPIETISNSEGGFERIYQGSALAFRWPLQLGSASSATVSLRLAARCSRDRTADELGLPTAVTAGR